MWYFVICLSEFMLGQISVLLKKCGPENLWGLNPHFPHILSTLSPHFINNVPIPTNSQLIINYLAMFSPKIPHYSTISPLSPHFKINILPTVPYFVNAQVLCGEIVGTIVGTMLIWEKTGVNVDTYIFLILLLNDSTTVGRMWGTC